jgi:hypothetical protein
MEKFEITLFTGEGLAEFTDRLGFILMELGVKFRVKEFHDDFMVFEFIQAERLDEDGKKKS